MTWDKPKASSAARGYGAAHRRERARWARIVEAGQATCCLCGEHIPPGSNWHLDHTPDRTAYRGAACAACNLSDAGRRARAKQDARPLRRWVL